MQTPAWIGTLLLPIPREAAWALPALQKAPGTLHHHTMFSDWEIVPWACCAETTSPQIGVVSPSSPKLSCPGPRWRRLCLKQDHHAASASSVCVCVALPVAALTHPTETAGGTPRSRAGAEQQMLRGGCWRNKDSASLGGTPLDSCGNHLLRTLSANTQFHPVALPPFPPVSACPFREDPSHTHLQGRNGEGTAGKTAGVEARPDLSLLEPRAGLPCWGQVLGLIGKTVFWLLFCRSMEGPSTPILQRPRRFLPFTQELGPKNIRSQV